MRITISGPARRLEGRERLPGDKSISHRALLFAALAHGPSRLTGWLHAGVTQALLDCLTALGTDHELIGDNDLLVLGRPWRTPTDALDCHASGTTMRLLLGALSGQGIHAQLTGTQRLQERPMGRVVRPLQRMGAQIEGVNGSTQPPLTLNGGALTGIEAPIEPASAQVKTALLVAGLHAEGSTTLLESTPTRDHTERLLRDLGAPLTVENGSVHLDGRYQIPPFELSIPGDFSSAAFLIAAATLLPRGNLELLEVGVNPTRLGFLNALVSMGADVTVGSLRFHRGEPVANIVVRRPSSLIGTRVSGPLTVQAIDELPILAVVATQADGETSVGDAGELRTKESDRISHLACELRKMGAEIEEAPNGFRIFGPTPLHGVAVESHHDHRLAMSLAVAGLIAKGSTIIEGAEWSAQSYPGFFSAIQRLTGAVET